MTSGASILETVEKIEAEKLQVEHAIVFLNRQQQSGSGLQFDLPVPSQFSDKLQQSSYAVTACVTLDEVVSVLLREQKIDEQVAHTIRSYVASNQIKKSAPTTTTVEKTAAVEKSSSSQEELSQETSKAFEAQEEKSSSSSSTTGKTGKAQEGELSFEQRAQLARTNAFSKQLFELMARKKSNLCLSADITDADELIRVIDQVGSEICLLKTHMDIVQLKKSSEDLHASQFPSYESLIQRIVELSEKHDFLIFEDRKFADIGNTVQHQYENGPFSIVQWSHLTNTHLVSGLSSVKALQQSAQRFLSFVEKDVAATTTTATTTTTRGCLVIAEMSTQDSLYGKPEFKQYFLQLSEQAAEECSDFVSGFICQGRFIKQSDRGAHLLYCTPGVNIDASADGLGQVYNSPEHVVGELKSDVIIVGRGIYHNTDPRQSAQEFRQRAWSAYEKRIAA